MAAGVSFTERGSRPLQPHGEGNELHPPSSSAILPPYGVKLVFSVSFYMVLEPDLDLSHAAQKCCRVCSSASLYPRIDKHFAPCKLGIGRRVSVKQCLDLQVHGCHNLFIALDLAFSRIPLVSYHYQVRANPLVNAK